MENKPINFSFIFSWCLLRQPAPSWRGISNKDTGNAQDLRKMLADERSVMSTMDMEHQQQLVELEQRHQEKVFITFTHVPVDISL